MQPNTPIRTERLTLTPPTEADRAQLRELLTDPTVTATYMVPPLSDTAALDRLIDRLIALGGTGGRLMLALRYEGVCAGIVHDVGVTEGTVELGYALRTPYHGRGLMTEAVRATLAHLFSLGVHAVRGGAFSGNVASVRVMTACGFSETGETEQIDYRGRTHECRYFEIKKP